MWCEIWFLLLYLKSRQLTRLVSQFTLYGHIKKGNKPDFHNAADVETARRLYDRFVAKVQDLYKAERVKNGVFQAMMEVELKNDGPVGVDYRSADEAVGLTLRSSSKSSVSPRGIELDG
jgi:D-tyrosyl-tRNA(Tyr) deacylase